MKGLDETPMACSLTAVELRDREATLLAQLRSAVVETEELQDGYAFRLSADSKSIRLIAELVVAERECGRFMTFEMAALPNLGPVIVRVIVACKCEGVLKHYPRLVQEGSAYPPEVVLDCSTASGWAASRDESKTAIRM